MKKRLRSFILIILTVVIFTVPMLLVACDKDDDDFYDKYYNIKYFYGEYGLPRDKFYTVWFWPNVEDGKTQEYKIVGVKKNSFVYATQENVFSKYEYKEMEFDENLLAEANRLIEFMGDHVEFRKGEVYFCDSRQSLTFPSEELWFNGDSHYYDKDGLFLNLYHWNENYYSIKYKKDVRILSIRLPENTVQDKNGVEWSVKISRIYKKTDGE